MAEAAQADSFRDGFCTNPGQAEAALMLACINKSPLPQPAQGLTACSSLLVVDPSPAGRPSTLQSWAVSRMARQQGRGGLMGCCTAGSPASGVLFASAVFAAHPMALQPSGPGLQLLWKPTPVAPVSPQANRQKWLLISKEPGPAPFFEEGSRTRAQAMPEVVRIIFREKDEKQRQAISGEAQEGSSYSVTSEDNLQAVVKKTDADHCFIIQASRPLPSGEIPSPMTGSVSSTCSAIMAGIRMITSDWA